MGFVLFFTFDNKEEMFISTHNSLLNTQTHPPFLSSRLSIVQHPAKVLAFYLESHPHTQNLPYLENFQFPPAHKCLFRYYFAYIIIENMNIQSIHARKMEIYFKPYDGHPSSSSSHPTQSLTIFSRLSTNTYITLLSLLHLLAAASIQYLVLFVK